MNRIILIGNGFDLAHGLETSYSHFIDDFWEGRIALIKDALFNDDIFTDEFITVKTISGLFPDSTALYSDLKKLADDLVIDFTFENEFLEKITEKRYQNWVDIENCYFQELMKIINDHELIKRSRTHYELNVENVKQLNKEFKQLKDELEEYLTSVIHKKQKITVKHEEITEKIYSDIIIQDLNSQGIRSFLDYKSEEIKNLIQELNYKADNETENVAPPRNSFITKYGNGRFGFNKKEWSRYINDLKLFNKYSEIKPSNYLFLNFNYTNTDKLYCNNQRYIVGEVSSRSIHIHGELNNANNPIIFGYGDEISEDYSRIERFTQNELFDYVKSVEYLNNNNYRNLFEFIESDEYQIFILGHSCGNSDRTLLNTLFEHDNCVSIKIYYHQKSIIDDDFSDKIKNISRNFKDKKKMRERVVNKKQCEPLRKH